jgi:tetratricopeptide (TPR) repeat protein
MLAIPVVGMPADARAATLAERFESGIAAFQAGRFDEAASVFQTLVERYDVQAPEAWLNLGAAAFEAGRPGPAILALHRAARLAPQDPTGETARVNLARIRSALNEREGPAGTGFVFGPYADAWTALLGWTSPTVALAVFLGCWTLFFVTLGLWRLGTWPNGRRPLGIAVTSLAVVLAATGLVAYGSHRVHSYQVAVVLADQAGLAADATSTRSELRLPEGLEVRVLANRGAWVQVRLSSGATGWMARDDLGIP